ncbi:MAG: hypothetical protein R3300_17575 [Candidatus Promineifilaceae bacterium]|nr:hypothetical protein [Candidatus Promineifilaceae bacterium]
MSEPASDVNVDSSSPSDGAETLSDEELMRLVADRVWEMLKRDLRIERERAAFFHGGRELRGR